MAVVDEPRIGRRPALIVAVACGLAFLALAIDASAGRPNGLDRTLADLLAARPATRPYHLADLVSLGGSPLFVALAASALALLAWRRRHDLRLVALCLSAPVVAGLLQVVTKHLVGPQAPARVNPWFLQHLVFPSGHAVGASVVATLTIVFVLTSPTTTFRRCVVVVAAVLYATAVATSRIVLDSHLAMDVIGGLLLGTAVTTFGAVLAVARSSVDHQAAPEGAARRRTVRPSTSPAGSVASDGSGASPAPRATGRE